MADANPRCPAMTRPKFFIHTPKPLPVPEMRAYTRPCRHCPSAHHPPDPEAEWIMAQPHAVRVENAFPCGWNGKRFCRGYCDRAGASDAELATLAGRYADRNDQQQEPRDGR